MGKGKWIDYILISAGMKFRNKKEVPIWYTGGAVPWLRQLVAGLSPRSPGFVTGSIHVGFVVEKVALGQVSLRVLRFSPVNIIPPSFYILIHYLGMNSTSVSGSSSET
jgi:hypothetical protein